MKLNIFFFILLILNFINQISNKKFSLSKIYINKTNRKLSETNNFITNIYYSEKDKYYFIKFYIGEKYIPQIYILDTTFSMISSPCNLCTTCEDHFFPFYNIDNENDIINCNSYQCTNNINPYYCEDEKCYFKNENNINDNKNIEGFLINSKIFINNTYNSNNNYEPKSLLISIPLGCTVKEGNYYKNKEANGIIGLNNNRNTFIDKIFNLNIIDDNLFTICLSKKGGYLSVGTINNFSNSNNINYIDLLVTSSNYNLYELIINFIQIEDENIYQPTISFIDSTSNISYFPTNIYNFIYETFIRDNKTDFSYFEEYGFCRINYENVNDKNVNLNEIFPKIIINFDGYNFEWEPENYFVESNIEIENTNQIALCIGIKESIEINDKIILGTNFMINHDIIFDKTQKKIGFTTANCDQFISLNNKINEGQSKLNEDEGENKSDTDKEMIESNNTNYNNNLTDEININNILINETTINDSNELSDFINNSIVDELNNTLINNVSSLISNISDETNITIINSNIDFRINDTIIDGNNESNIFNNTIIYTSNIIANDSIDENINEIINETNNNSIIDELNDTINTFDNTTLVLFNDTFSDDINMTIDEYLNDTINNTINDTINDTINEIINETINDTINETINETINDTINDTINETINETINDTINSSIIYNEINVTIIETYFENKTEIINDINITNINSSIILNNNITNNITEKTEENLESIISTSINQEKEKSSSTESLNNENINNIINDESPTNAHINIEIEKDTDNKEDNSIFKKIFNIIKSFLKNKLMYFLFALLGIILCFVVVILIACAIISCVKMFKRRNYMRQVDIDVPKESKYNTASLSSRSS